MSSPRAMREAGLIDRRRHLILYGETWDRYRHGRDDCLIAECTCEWSCTDAEDEAELYRAVAAHLDGRGEAPRKVGES